MTPAAYLYICDGDIDNPVLTHKKMDWPEKYPHWQEIALPFPPKWPALMRGVRVEGDTVVITVKGGNEAARELCAALIEEMSK